MVLFDSSSFFFFFVYLILFNAMNANEAIHTSSVESIFFKLQLLYLCRLRVIPSCSMPNELFFCAQLSAFFFAEIKISLWQQSNRDKKSADDNDDDDASPSKQIVMLFYIVIS